MEIKTYETMAKLNLTEPERVQLTERVNELIASFDLLEHVGADVSGAEPLVSVLDRQTVLREDVSVKFITREELLSNAPEQYDGYFQVPRTLE